MLGFSLVREFINLPRKHIIIKLPIYEPSTCVQRIQGVPILW
jgi:hypothetical protein